MDGWQKSSEKKSIQSLDDPRGGEAQDEMKSLIGNTMRWRGATETAE